jgi:hypothetical protein
VDEDRPGHDPDEVPEDYEDSAEESWEDLAEDLRDADDVERDEADAVPEGWWRPTWALVLAVAFATLQVVGVVVGLASVVFDLLHDNPAIDGILARVGAYLVVVFTLTAAAWAYYLARPRVRSFVFAASCMVGVPAVGYLVLRAING